MNIRIFGEERSYRTNKVMELHWCTLVTENKVSKGKTERVPGSVAVNTLAKLLCKRIDVILPYLYEDHKIVLKGLSKVALVDKFPS